MSDEASASTKRGRKSEKAETKKRPRKEVKQPDSGDDEIAPPKKGRGKPKSSIKKKSAAPKSKSTSVTKGRRGRSKKEKKPDSAEDENEENDTGEDD